MEEFTELELDNAELIVTLWSINESLEVIQDLLEDIVDFGKNLDL